MEAQIDCHLFDEWYKILEQIFSICTVDFHPSGYAFGNLRGWMPLAFVHGGVDLNNMDQYKGELTSEDKANLCSDWVDLSLYCRYSYTLPTIIAIDCNAQTAEDRFARFAYNPYCEHGLDLVLAKLDGGVKIEKPLYGGYVGRKDGPLKRKYSF